jgi:hypothetical protein
MSLLFSSLPLALTEKKFHAQIITDGTSWDVTVEHCAACQRLLGPSIG